MPPPQYKKYPLDQTDLSGLKKKIIDLLKENKIWVSDSPYRAPILFSRKKDWRIYPYVDYHVLNKKAISDSYPPWHINELLSWLKGTQYFSCLDLRDGYFHISIAKEDLYKTVFSYRYGMFRVLCYTIWAYECPKDI